MSLFTNLAHEAAARARTNMLTLPGALEAIIDQLSAPTPGVGHIQAGVVEVTRPSGERTDTYYQRVDATIKEYIRQKLSLPAGTGVHYTKFSARQGRFGFLFLSGQAPTPGQVRQVISDHSLDHHKVIESLLDLRLKLSFITDVEKRYDISPVEFNAELYLGMMFSYARKDEAGVFDALRFQVYFSRQQEIALSLHRVMMECAPDAKDISRPVTESGTLMFDWAGRRFQLKRRLSATKSDRNFMAFATSNENPEAYERYENSINYHVTDCLNRLLKILDQAGVESRPVEFQATHQVRKFLESIPDTTNPLWVLDTTTDPKRKAAVESLANTIGAAKVVNADSLPAPEALLERDVSYLVVSEASPEAGSSIVDRSSNVSYTTFWQAMAAQQKNPKAQFDFYTAAKINRFLGGKATICQGFDLKPGKALSKTALEKCLQELALKEAIYKHGVVTVAGAQLPRASLVLISCRRDTDKNAYFQVLDVLVEGEQIKIERTRRYDQFSKGEFNEDFRQLSAVLGKASEKPFDTIWNDTFLIHDKGTNAWLTAFNSGRVPDIIGNALFDNQVRQDEGTSPSREVGIQVSALPYYLTPTKQKQRHSIFIQDNGEEGAWYFVASNKAANNTIAKQSLVYNVVITDEAGTRLPVLSHPLGELFFSTFTYDIVKLRESAKTSILQKIVELCLKN
ncbi:hypothetical protein HNP46_006060 [Pseudomonas nitritireducens]|uniref:Uncharacterized protein n=1 Tax=Pseudomonas nitroreducens TaxID=46680 RepID=A0A7W7KQJ1_PSENT|nr:hypothetical protein [Pseudomonas nitritireducens]MBB4867149.1 hypothetical protein [Pseudomonas nitritireducens]